MSVLILLLFTIILLCERYSLVCGNLSTKNTEKIRKCIAYFFLIFITSFRYNVGWDYLTYYNFLEKPGGAPYFEPAVRLFYYIAQFFNAPWILFAIFFILTMLFILLGIRERSSNEYESVIIFMALFYFESMNIIRQFLAIAILFYAFKYVKSKRLICYVIWVFVASLVHTSAWFVIPVYFIYNYVQLKSIAVFVVIGVTFSDRIVRIILGRNEFYKYYQYYINMLNDGGNFIRFFYLLLAICCITVYIQKRQHFDKDISKSLSVFIFGVIFPFMIGSHMGLRITYYYAVEIMILIPKMLDQMHLKKGRRAIMLPFYAYYITFLAVDYMNNKGFSPFTFYWNQ